MEWRRGITGFRHIDDPPLPDCDFKAFRSHCFVSARALGGEVRSIEAPYARSTRNYAEVVLELPSRPVAVLFNAHFPIVAFAALPRDDTELRFVDVPELAELFLGFGGYEVLTASAADGPVTGEVCRQLAPAEIDQLRCWRPKRLGEVVFNDWD